MWLNIACFTSVFLLGYSRVLDEGCTDLASLPIRNVNPKVIQVTGTGILYSPGFQKNEPYPNSVQCIYQLLAPSNMHVRLKFNYVDIDVSDFCQSDSMGIHDFDSNGRSVVLHTHCGKRNINDYVSKSYAMMVILRTDAFAGKRGFNITYSPQSTTDVCPSGQKTSRNRNCVSASDSCNGNDDCGDGSDEENCNNPLPTTQCGVSDVPPDTSAIQDRIVGGREVRNGSWPWMADLQLSLAEPNGHFCGGSLINAQWVVSAAHCFGSYRRPDQVRIHLGNHRKYEKDVGEQVRYAERIVIYDDIPSNVFENNGKFDLVNDVALIKLNAPVKFTKFVKPVCLPMRLVAVNTNCYAIGWGATRGTGSNSALKQAPHPIQSSQECQRLVGGQFNPQTMICAGLLTRLNGVCHGDSGGPLLCKGNNTWNVAGVASYVTAGTGTQGLCGLAGNPSVFNRLDAKLSWINRMINKYS